MSQLEIVREFVLPEIEIIKEQKTDFSEPTIVGEACFLELDVKGGNGRVYPKSLIEECHEYWRPLMRRKGWLGELDHPFGNNVERDIVISLQNASHAILDVQTTGNLVYGKFQTTPNLRGLELARYLKGGFGVGFSLRGLGRFIKESDQMIATKPFILITYDSVANPSFKKAFVKSITVETLIAAARAAKEYDLCSLLQEVTDRTECELCQVYREKHIDQISIVSEVMKEFNRLVETSKSSKELTHNLEQFYETYLLKPFE